MTVKQIEKPLKKAVKKVAKKKATKSTKALIVNEKPKRGRQEVARVKEHDKTLSKYPTAYFMGMAVKPDKIPSNLLKLGYSPAWIVETLEGYIQSEKGIIETIKPPKAFDATKCNINENGEGQGVETSRNKQGVYMHLIEIMKNDELVGSYYQQSKALKAEIYLNRAFSTIEDGPESLPESCFTISTYKDGETDTWHSHKVLTSAGIAYLKTKADSYLQRAKMTERGHINDKKPEQIVNIVNNNYVQINIKDIMGRDISELSEQLY